MVENKVKVGQKPFSGLLNSVETHFGHSILDTLQIQRMINLKVKRMSNSLFAE